MCVREKETDRKKQSQKETKTERDKRQKGADKKRSSGKVTNRERY